jgi:hypothetical protein
MWRSPHSPALFCGGVVLGEDVVWVKCRLRGEPARIIRELKERGVALSVREVIVQALVALEERTLERDLRSERIRGERRGEE